MPLKEYAGHVLHSSIQIGDDVYIGTDAFLVSGCGITIGNGCVLSDQVYINDTHHGLDPTKGPILSQPMETKGPIVIEEGCFIGYRAIVLSGVTLGHHCVVGAGAVVTKSFPPYSAIGGVPARLLRTTTDEVQAIGA
jgi:acetyltransferase-like isoleucine patch superfamily enzyme